MVHGPGRNDVHLHKSSDNVGRALWKNRTLKQTALELWRGGGLPTAEAVPSLGEDRVPGDITLSHTEQRGAAVLISHSLDPAGRFYLLYADDADSLLFHDQQLIVAILV